MKDRSKCDVQIGDEVRYSEGLALEKLQLQDKD